MTKISFTTGNGSILCALIAFSVCELAAAQSEPRPDLLYGRITTGAGLIYEGQLRFGGNEEAAWGHQFNGVKKENVWSAYVPRERLRETIPVELFGFWVGSREREIDTDRPFMARFGDISRIDAAGRELRVTLKSGTAFTLDRFSADDFADGLRVQDANGNSVDLDEWDIRSVEFLPMPESAAARGQTESTAELLHGTVHTVRGDFTGFIQWNREQGLTTDMLDASDGGIVLPFAEISSIARQSNDSALVTLVDASEIVISNTRQVGPQSRGVYVDDERYGRVLISWSLFEHLDFSAGGSGPAYDDFSPGMPLAGSVLTRSGRRLTGRLVYDLDESETTETLDAPRQGIDYIISFSQIASVELPDAEAGDAVDARVTLHSGEELPLERSGDLGDGNAGMLIFTDSTEAPEYVRWEDVARIDFAPTGEAILDDQARAVVR